MSVRSIVDPLACICHHQGRATIYIHQVLNHTDTPVEVFHRIHKHELLHLVIRRDVEGMTRMIRRNPAGRAGNLPERSLAWAWLWRISGTA